MLFKGIRPALLTLLLCAACAAGPVAAVDPVSTGRVGPPLPTGSVTGEYLAALHGESTGDWQAAAELLASVAMRTKDNPALQERAFIVALSAGDLPRAEALAPAIPKASSQSYFAALTLVVKEMREGKLDEAAARIKAMGDAQLGLYTKPVLLAWVEEARGRHKEARALLDKIDGDNDLGALYALHRGFLGAVQSSKDAGQLIRAAAKPPAPLRAAVAAARQLRADGDSKGAVAVMDEFLKDNPQSRIAQIERQGVLGKQPPPPLVRTAREGMGEALFNLAGAFQQQQAGQLVQIFGTLSASLKPDDPLIQLMLGDTAAGREQWDVARAAYERIPADSPFRLAALLRAASIAEAAKQQDEAVRLLNLAAATAPTAADPLLQLGDLYRRAEDYAAAINAYDAAIARIGTPGPGDWEAYYGRAIAWFERENWPKSEADLKQALKLDPDQPYVLNFLAYSWADQGENLVEAEKLLRKALAGAPDDGAIIDSVGWVLFRQGKAQEALTYLQRAVTKLPTDPEVNDHLGDVYAALGRTLEARYQWQRAYDEAVRRKMQRLIDRIGPKLKDAGQATK